MSRALPGFPQPPGAESGSASAVSPAGAPAFEPIRVLECELADPDGGLSPAGDTPRHRRGRVLVRLHGLPLGVVDCDASTADLPASVLELARARFASEIEAHLLADETHTGAGSRCVAEREAFKLRAPLASVVIATRERPQSLATTLDDLWAQIYPRFEVIVVDNAPQTDATRALVEEHAASGRPVRYIREPLPGLAVAHNRGLTDVRGELVAFTDDDVRIDRLWLLELARAFELADDVACVTGLIVPSELETPAQLWLEEWIRVNKGYEQKLFDTGSNRPAGRLFPYAAGLFGSGANMAFRTDALRALGGFDPALGTGTRARGGDDLASFYSIIAAGHTLVYQPSAIVHHAYRRDLESLKAQMYDYGAGLGAFLTKVVVERPDRLLDLAWRVPFGAAHLARSRPSARPAFSPGPLDGLAGALARRERLGMLAGLRGYVLERRARRALYATRTGPVRHPKAA